MASLTKRCRHRGAQRETCGCTWYIRQRQAGRDTYTPVGADRAKAERPLARLSRRRDETVSEAVDAWLAAKEREPGARAGSLATYQGRAGHLHGALTRDTTGSTLGGYDPAARHDTRRSVLRGDLPWLSIPPGE